MTNLNSSELLGWSEFSQLDDAINPEVSDLGKLLAKRGETMISRDKTTSAALDTSALLGWSEFQKLDNVTSPNSADLGKLFCKRSEPTGSDSEV